MNVHDKHFCTNVWYPEKTDIPGMRTGNFPSQIYFLLLISPYWFLRTLAERAKRTSRKFFSTVEFSKSNRFSFASEELESSRAYRPRCSLDARICLQQNVTKALFNHSWRENSRTLKNSAHIQPRHPICTLLLCSDRIS